MVVVYKVDYFVKGSLSSSLVLLNTKVVSLLNSLSLSHNNIRTVFFSIFFFDLTSLSKSIPVHDHIISQVIVALCCSTKQSSDLKREKSRPIGSAL